MQLILARHGNTFNPGDAVVWAGATNDLPLVAAGIEQAELCAEYLLANGLHPTAIYVSPLIRTRRFAEIIIEKLNLKTSPITDKRLQEIDYGEWTGRTDKEIIEKFGQDQLDEWSQYSRWPHRGNWGGSEAGVIEDVRSFVKDLLSKHGENDTILVVSSNGRLRYFLTLIPGEFEKKQKNKTLKVKTGGICKMRISTNEIIVEDWNVDPAKVKA